MADINALAVEMRVCIAWWLRPYLTAAVILHRLGFPVGFGRVGRTTDRAITFAVGGSRPRHVFSNRLA